MEQAAEVLNISRDHVETQVVFDAPWDEVARYVRPPMGRLEPIDDGERCVLIGTTSNPAMYAGEWLAAIPARFHVAGGPELRAAVTAVIGRLTAALGAAPGNERFSGKITTRPIASCKRETHPARAKRQVITAMSHLWGQPGRQS